MMDLLIGWYLAVFLGFGATTYARTREPETRPPQVRMLPPWLADLTAHTEPLEGYQDPLFFTDSKQEHGTTTKP
jgi:hypothetical protein